MKQEDVQLQSAHENGRITYRLVYQRVSSPELRSLNAAKVFLQEGKFDNYVHGLALVTGQAAEDAKWCNARSDKELEAILNPPTLLSISQ